MPDPQGRFLWYELVTTDVAAARAFYGAVVGWGAQNAPPPNADYFLFTAAETPVAGLMALPEAARTNGSPPAWIGYVGVDDVDSVTARAQELGGGVYMPPTDIPTVGRFSCIADPQKAAIALFTPSGPGMEPPPGPPSAGHIAWRELAASDWPAAFDFYAAMFGWKKAEAVEMGPMGTYQIFAIGEESAGGMFNKPPMVPAPFWLYYFAVGDIDAAAGRVTASGGKVLNGPMEVPGGGWILQGMDPQGAMFALFGKRG